MILVRVIVDAVEQAGASREEFLRLLRIDPMLLSDVSVRFELEEFARLQVCALDVTGDDALGLHVAERAPVTSFDLMSHLTSHARTMREAFGLVAQFQRLLMDDCHIGLSEKAGAATIRYSFTRSAARADRMHAEFVVTALLRFARAFGGRNLTPRIASFEHPRPAHSGEYVRIFKDAARFNQPVTALTFDCAVLDRVHLHQHPELFAVLRTEAERALERVTHGPGPVDQLRQYLLAQPPGRVPALSTTAKDLGRSSRSLRRVLATQGSGLETPSGRPLGTESTTIVGAAVRCVFAPGCRSWSRSTS
jgi:hypothetical protein